MDHLLKVRAYHQQMWDAKPWILYVFVEGKPRRPRAVVPVSIVELHLPTLEMRQKVARWVVFSGLSSMSAELFLAELDSTEGVSFMSMWSMMDDRQKTLYNEVLGG